MTQLSANVSDSTHVSKISIGVFKSLPMFQKKTNEVSFVFKHGVSKYASIIIDICAAHLSLHNNQSLDLLTRRMWNSDEFLQKNYKLQNFAIPYYSVQETLPSAPLFTLSGFPLY